MKKDKKLPNEGLEQLNKVAPEVVTRMGYSKGGTIVKTFEARGNHEQESGFGAVRSDVKSFGKGKA
tara:strand:+ start:72 stop:269 length:198 start_codon:yes stop_codon:yes gene_type:complete